VTVVTASEAETSHAACAVAWKHRAVAAEAGRSYLKGACPRTLQGCRAVCAFRFVIFITSRDPAWETHVRNYMRKHMRQKRAIAANA
jgi:hypothetical protein